jgi:hypothetical protein
VGCTGAYIYQNCRRGVVEVESTTGHYSQTIRHAKSTVQWVCCTKLDKTHRNTGLLYVVLKLFVHISSADKVAIVCSVALLCIKWYCLHYSNDWGATHSRISPFWIRDSVVFNCLLLLQMAVSHLLISNFHKSLMRQHSIESQITWIFINTPVRTSDLSVAITMWLSEFCPFCCQMWLQQPNRTEILSHKIHGPLCWEAIPFIPSISLWLYSRKNPSKFHCHYFNMLKR